MATVSVADILKQATASLNMVAEAEARLAAAGHVSLSTWEKQAKAVEYLTGRQRMQNAQEEKLSKNAKTLTDSFKGVQSSLAIASATLTGTFFEIRHLAGQANPGLLHAFDGALGLLQARMAGSLLPVFDAVIDGVMETADWFDSLSDGSKKLIAGGLVTVPALIGLGTALRALSPVLALAAAATRRFTAAAQQNAAMSAVGGVAGVAGVVGVLYSLGVFDDYDHKKHEGQTTAVTEEEFKEGRGAFASFKKEFDEMMALKPEERVAEARRRAERLRGMAAEERTHWYIPSSVPESREQRAEMYERIAAHGVATNKDADQAKEEKRARREIQRASMRVDAVQRENQPRYSPLAEARKQLQLQLLGKNRYEQEILKEQRKHREEEIKRLDRLISEFQTRFPNARLSD